MLDRLYVTAPSGMGFLLAQELAEYGIDVLQEMRGGVYVPKSIPTGYRICLWSRIANRVLWPLATFPAASEDLLYDGVNVIPWETHLAPDGTLAVDANCVQSALTHSHYVALKTKDAVVDRIRDKSGERPSVDVRDPGVQINTYLYKDVATISIDLAGQSLYRRGYRTVGLEAPLKENLAAGLLYRAGWPRIVQEGGVLVDPMCGTGTFLIEAALMACKAAPGLLRSRCGVGRWLQHDKETWSSLVEEARKVRVRGARDLVFGSDWDQRSVQVAQQHAKQAGVDGLVRVVESDVRDAKPPDGAQAGLFIANPPYGQRIGEEHKLSGLYRTIGEQLKGYWPGWTAAIFTGNPSLCRELRLRPRRTYEYRNGSIPCRFAIYKLATSDRLQAQAATEPGVEMLENRFRRNLRHIGKWARRNGISCYRLYDGDLPEYGLAVDLYADVEGNEMAHVTVAVSEREGLLTEARKRSGIASLKAVLGLSDDQVVVKSRSRQLGDAQYERLSTTDAYRTIQEGKAKLLVNLTDFHDTGLFLDNRFVRAYIQDLAQDKRFLNLFGYTGSVTVSAALGGAKASTTVDLSNTYCEWARRNFDVNGLSPEAHVVVRADCLKWIREATVAPDRYDLIYFDPPTFSNSKGMDEALDVQRDHEVWIERALSLLSDGGRLIFRNNRRGFRMQFQSAEHHVRDISRRTLATDFERQKKGHHCFEIMRRDLS